MSWEARLSEFDGPPLDEWALILGDAIHNLRSALDVLVWAHVDTAALNDKQARQIAFPVWSEREAWDGGAARVLRTVPNDVVGRIEECQPFRRPPSERAGDGLHLLNGLDNTDKHRLALTASARPQEVDATHTLEFASEEASARNAPPDLAVFEPALVSSALLLRGTTVDPIVDLRASHSVTIKIGLDTAGGFVGATELVEQLAVYVATIVAHVAGVGPLPPSASGE
jgi:hypothetical protein